MVDTVTRSKLRGAAISKRDPLMCPFTIISKSINPFLQRLPRTRLSRLKLNLLNLDLASQSGESAGSARQRRGCGGGTPGKTPPHIRFLRLPPCFQDGRPAIASGPVVGL